MRRQVHIAVAGCFIPQKEGQHDIYDAFMDFEKTAQPSPLLVIIFHESTRGCGGGLQNRGEVMYRHFGL
jgi:hypothetical protein